MYTDLTFASNATAAYFPELHNLSHLSPITHVTSSHATQLAFHVFKPINLRNRGADAAHIQERMQNKVITVRQHAANVRASLALFALFVYISRINLAAMEIATSRGVLVQKASY